jgi:hypothetical protein
MTIENFKKSYSLWNAPIILALEVRFRIALRTIFRQLVAVVSAIVLSVAEQPFRDASVVRLARTTRPSCGAVSLATHVSRLVRIVSAIVVKVAHPQFRDAASVLATEFSVRIALSII